MLIILTVFLGMAEGTAVKTGGKIMLRDNDTISARLVFPVDCQNAIIRILQPARKNPQK